MAHHHPFHISFLKLYIADQAIDAKESADHLSYNPSLFVRLANPPPLPVNLIKQYLHHHQLLFQGLETKVGDGEDTVLLDLLAGGEDLPDEQIEMDCMRGDLHSLLHQLPDLQCRVLRMRYGMDGDEPMSLTGIGRVLGISRDRVRNLERDGLRGLRRLSDNVEAYFVS